MLTPASVRRKLIERFESLALFKRDRTTALYHYCVALELIPTPLSDNSDLTMAKGRHALEASIRAVPAIFRLCPVVSNAPSFEINPAAFSYGYDRLRFIKPVFIGDTLYAKCTVKEKRDHPKRPDHGVVVELVESINQRQETVLAAEHLLLVKRKVS